MAGIRKRELFRRSLNYGSNADNSLGTESDRLAIAFEAGYRAARADMRVVFNTPLTVAQKFEDMRRFLLPIK